MSIPNPADAPPLLTEADALRRVAQLVGPAIAERQLWIMLVDGDGRQAPVVMPVSDLPPRPPGDVLDGLAQVLAGLRGDLATDAGPGSVILTFERRGSDAALSADREWAAALIGTCEHAGMALRGLFLSTDTGVLRLQP